MQSAWHEEPCLTAVRYHREVKTCLQACPQMSTSDAKANVLRCVARTTDDGLMSDPISDSAGTQSMLKQGGIWLMQGNKPGVLTHSTRLFPEYPGLESEVSGLPR